MRLFLPVIVQRALYSLCIRSVHAAKAELLQQRASMVMEMFVENA
jgi:hypothetical protein